VHLCTLLESPPHIVEVEDVVSIVGLLAPLRDGGYCFSSGQALLKLVDLIWWSPAEV
jgi:hypothetical protein